MRIAMRDTRIYFFFESNRKTRFVFLACYQYRNKNLSRSFRSSNPRHSLSLVVKGALILLRADPAHILPCLFSFLVHRFTLCTLRGAPVHHGPLKAHNATCPDVLPSHSVNRRQWHPRVYQIFPTPRQRIVTLHFKKRKKDHLYTRE